MLVAEGAAEICRRARGVAVGSGRAAGDRRGGRRPVHRPRRRRAADGGGRDRHQRSCARRRAGDRRRAEPCSVHTCGHGAPVRQSEPASRATRADRADAPLATRMRPGTLDEFVGQERLLGAGSALRRAIEEGHPHSMILHGPPGSGKTTLARLIAEASGAAFEEESAVQAGRAEVRAVIERARERLRGDRQRDDLLPRRDPPLQQGPAGRAAAGGRGGAADADRRDHREPVLRGQLGAALAQPVSTSSTRSTPADVRTLLDRAVAARRVRSRPGPDRRGRARVPRRALGRRRAHRAERPRAGLRGGRRGASR